MNFLCITRISIVQQIWSAANFAILRLNQFYYCVAANYTLIYFYVRLDCGESNVTMIKTHKFIDYSIVSN